ncbi:MAG: hypothetical protein FWB74_01320 [Defluviitaleaceae bacterium]|nr:hypothetical protein [Defluviitaleaceae bacterium]
MTIIDVLTQTPKDSKYTDEQIAWAKGRLMEELEKGRLSGEEHGYVHAKEVRAYFKGRYGEHD